MTYKLYPGGKSYDVKRLQDYGNPIQNVTVAPNPAIRTRSANLPDGRIVERGQQCAAHRDDHHRQTPAVRIFW